MTQKQKTQSPFGLAAQQLDAAFMDFERLSQRLAQLDLESEKGLEQARSLLSEVDGCRVALEREMQAMATELEQARTRSEQAAQAILERALAVQSRQRDVEAMLGRFQELGAMVKQISTAVGGLKVQDPGKLTPQEQAVLDETLPPFNEQISRLVDEARKLMDDARAAKMKSLERQADALRQSLQAARHRLNHLWERGRPQPLH